MTRSVHDQPPAGGVSVVALDESRVDGFRAALDAVARERRWISAFEAPPIEQMRAFVAGNARAGNPQFVALDADGSVIGWCDIVRKHFPAVAHAGSLGMGVIEPWRGRGVGRRLLGRALEAADAAGLLRVELWVRVDNARAIALYERHGFEVEGRGRRLMRIDGQDIDCWLMARLPRP